MSERLGEVEARLKEAEKPITLAEAAAGIKPLRELRESEMGLLCAGESTGNGGMQHLDVTEEDLGQGARWVDGVGVVKALDDGLYVQREPGAWMKFDEWFRRTYLSSSHRGFSSEMLGALKRKGFIT